MLKACLRDNQPFGVCAIREGAEVGAPATPHEVGTLARISEWQMPQLGLFHVTAGGEQRFRILERQIETNGLQRARIELLEPRLAELLPLSLAAKQELLEMSDAALRLERLSALLRPGARAAS